MLTNEGKLHIKRYMAGYVPSIGQAMAFGIGNRAEASSDRFLQLEAARAPISLISYDMADNQIVFKAEVPDEFIGKVHEIGLYSLTTDPNAFGSRLVTSFDSGVEDWINPADSTPTAFGTTAVRLGGDALRLAPALSTTATSSLKNVNLDLSGFSGSDGFTFAFNCLDANANQITFRFLKDSSNYYSFNMGAQATSGYKIVDANKSTAVVTGSPDWSQITEVQVIVTAKATGTAVVEFDAIRIEDKDSVNLDFLLVARKVVPAPYTKIAGQPQDIEFALDFII